MPLPKRKPGEKQNEFMIRCTSDDTMIKEYPRQDQRIAVCIAQYKK